MVTDTETKEENRHRGKVVAVVGPTASGKTALAVALAKHFAGEVISCDSMQLYRDMDIGTAKPTKEEMDGVPHHLLDILAPDEPFSCAEYAALAAKTADGLLARGVLPIFCGGTGLYLDGVLRGGNSYEKTETDADYRASLETLAQREGAGAVHALLAAVDPAAAEATHPNNVKRVIRALEIYHTTGLTKTELDRRSREVPPRYDALILGIRFPDAEVLYGRIDARVDEMMRLGLCEECRRLWEAGVFERSKTAAQAIGYKELFPYLRGEASLESCVDTLKQATRHYAKRQMTWFRAHGDVTWLDRAADTTAAALTEQAVATVRAFLEK